MNHTDYMMKTVNNIQTALRQLTIDATPKNVNAALYCHQQCEELLKMVGEEAKGEELNGDN